MATDLTGFGFPFHGIDPAIVVWIVSTTVPVVAIVLLAFIVLGVLAVGRFRPEPVGLAPAVA